MNKLKVSCIQLDMKFCDTDYNYSRAQELIRETVKKEKTDVAVLPEMWSTGYYPKDNLASFCEKDGDRIKKSFSALAKELDVNIVGGSIANIKNGGIFNTMYVFNRKGELAAEYDKTHLFTPMDEHLSFEFGSQTPVFELDGHGCAAVICYDIRFPELVRTLALKGIELLFVCSQWPEARIPHLQTLSAARAIENQMFTAVCNSCGTADGTKFGGCSRLINPWGDVLAEAGDSESVVTAEMDFGIIEEIRNSINVFRDRRPELYRI